MDINKQWLALGIVDVFGKEIPENKAKYQKLFQETFELGDKFRLDPCFETLYLLMHDQIDYQGNCLVDHIEIKRLLHYPSLRRSPAQKIFSELAGVVLNPDISKPLGKTVARAEYELLEQFCEAVEVDALDRREIFWVIQHCASAEATGQAVIDREEWQYLALHFHKVGRKPKRFFQLQKKYLAISTSQKQFFKPDHIHPVCKEYGACWQESHTFILKHGVSLFEPFDAKCLKKTEHILSELESFLEKIYQSRKPSIFGSSMSAALVIYLHWMIAWYYFAKAQNLGAHTDQDRASQNRTLSALEQCRSHLMGAYTQEARFSQTHTYKQRKVEAILYCQIALADINRLLASFTSSINFQADQMVQTDPYGEYVKFSREILKQTQNGGFVAQDFWLQQAVFELTTNTTLLFPDEVEVSERMSQFFKQNKGVELDKNRYRTRNTSNRLFYVLSHARQFFLEAQQMEDTCRNEYNVSTHFTMPEINIDVETCFCDVVSRFHNCEDGKNWSFYLDTGDELLLKAHVLKSDWLEVCGYVWKALYHMQAAHKEVKQAWYAEKEFEKGVSVLKTQEFTDIPKSELQRFTSQLIALQAKACLHVASQAQSLYTGFEDQIILSTKDKTQISKEWRKKATSLKAKIKKVDRKKIKTKKRPLIMVILDEWIEDNKT